MLQVHLMTIFKFGMSSDICSQITFYGSSRYRIAVKLDLRIQIFEYSHPLIYLAKSVDPNKMSDSVRFIHVIIIVT